MMDLPRLLIFLLAAWRIASLVFREAGPWDIFVHFRTAIGSTGVGQQALTCMWCISVWVGLTLTPLVFWEYGYLCVLPFALSAGVILIDQQAVRRD